MLILAEVMPSSSTTMLSGEPAYLYWTKVACVCQTHVCLDLGGATVEGVIVHHILQGMAAAAAAATSLRPITASH
jgi:hypothetical protein